MLKIVLLQGISKLSLSHRLISSFYREVFSIIHGLLHRVSHVSSPLVMPSYLALLVINESGVISPLHREHPPVLGTHHVHLHILRHIILVVLHLYRLVMGVYRASVRLVVIALVVRLLDHPLGI
jgi:hypothetical protein